MNLSSSEEIKNVVRMTYAGLVNTNQSCCGGGSCGADGAMTSFAESYQTLDGYVSDADLGLGCGLPTEHAGIKRGDTVVDLGSGAGNDVFVAQRLVGEDGHVIGIDFTPEMIERARRNADQLVVGNVEFMLGDIEELPLDDASADVVVSNCVLNLVPNKERAFAEMHRVLNPSGHFCVSDIVTTGTLPEAVREVASLYAGCVSGALEVNRYLQLLRDAGFSDVQIVQTREVELPDEAIAGIVSEADVHAFRESGSKLLSITVTGSKR